MLHPINAKSYMIEGVWPHVRDDDWCGEWKQTLRRLDTRIAAESGAVAGVKPPMLAPRSAPLSTVFAGASNIGATSGGNMAATSGRGD